MEIRTMIITILLASGIFIAGSVFMNDWGTSYNQTIDVSSINQTAEITNDLANLSNLSTQKITGVSVIDAPLLAVKGFIEFMDLVKNVMYTAYQNLISNVAFYLNIPNYWAVIFTAIVITIILTVVISAIVRWRI